MDQERLDELIKLRETMGEQLGTEGRAQGPGSRPYSQFLVCPMCFSEQ